jgi:aldehyde dehydrogenase (NAD+)
VSLPANRETLCETIEGEAADVDVAVQAARAAFGPWAALAPHERAKHLYSIARHVQKHHRLLACIESLDNGKSLRETRDSDIPLVARHFYHHAGWAQLMEDELPKWKPLGVIGEIVPWNFPLMLLAWKVCPALAMGNTVVVKPASYTRLSALLFAEICAEAGLPPGVFNVISGSGAIGSDLADHPDVDKMAFTGSTPIGRVLRRRIAGSGKKLSLELGGKSPVIVFDNADLDAACEGLVDAIFFNQGQVCSAGSRLLVQESVHDQLLAKLKRRNRQVPRRPPARQEHRHGRARRRVAVHHDQVVCRQRRQGGRRRLRCARACAQQRLVLAADDHLQRAACECLALCVAGRVTEQLLSMLASFQIPS